MLFALQSIINIEWHYPFCPPNLISLVSFGGSSLLVNGCRRSVAEYFAEDPTPEEMEWLPEGTANTEDSHDDSGASCFHNEFSERCFLAGGDRGRWNGDIVSRNCAGGVLSDEREWNACSFRGSTSGYRSQGSTSGERGHFSDMARIRGGGLLVALKGLVKLPWRFFRRWLFPLPSSPSCDWGRWLCVGRGDFAATLMGILASCRSKTQSRANQSGCRKLVHRIYTSFNGAEAHFPQAGFAVWGIPFELRFVRPWVGTQETREGHPPRILVFGGVRGLVSQSERTGPPEPSDRLALETRYHSSNGSARGRGNPGTLPRTRCGCGCLPVPPQHG